MKEGGRDKEKERMDRRTFIIRNWFTQLWRLRSSRICCAQAGEQGEPVVEIPGQMQEKNHVPARKSKIVRQRELILLYSTFCSVQSPDWMRPIHTGRATCFTELTSSNVPLTQKRPHTYTHPGTCLNKCLGTPRLSQVE